MYIVLKVEIRDSMYYPSKGKIAESKIEFEIESTEQLMAIAPGLGPLIAGMVDNATHKYTAHEPEPRAAE